MTQNDSDSTTVVTTTKSMGISILLTALFGPLGMLYSTIAGAIIMLIISALVALLTFGWGVIFTWPICIIWAALATRSYNNKLKSNSSGRKKL